MPDDDCYPNTTCLNVNYYSLNSAKYFTSNSELSFQPGQHTLLSDLVIRNATNISLVGSLSDNKNKTPETLITCNSSFIITFTNITNLTIKNMEIAACGDDDNVLYILNCTNLNLQYIVTQNQEKIYKGIYGLNIFGESYITHIKNHMLSIEYMDIELEEKNHTLFVLNYYANQTNDNDTRARIFIRLAQKLYKVHIEISETSMSNLYGTAMVQV